MNILILGSGAREHVLAWKVSESPRCTTLYIAPGNAGTAKYGQNVALNTLDKEALADFCLSAKIDMVIPGNEDPLVEGVTDYLEKNLPGILVAGPSQKGAQLEGSKDFAKEFMLKHGIPTARFSTFTKATLNQGYQFLETLTPPFVLKADGLAAGKGVLILPDLAQAKQALKEMLEDNKFGKASDKVVIEEFLTGIELSCFVLTDGKHYLLLPEAKDYKRIGEGDEGLNTGGMGAVSPVPFANEAFMQKVITKIVQPSVNGLRNDKMNYKGFLFIGLINCNGEPFVIEYNVRLGDPETEVVLPRLNNDLVDLLEAACKQTLDQHLPQINPAFATTVFTVSKGYPEAYEKGKEIRFDHNPSPYIFHAGTTQKEDKIVTSGGRVIACTAMAPSLQEALDAAYRSVESIHFEGKTYRRDIGKDLLQYL
jgi:phosphoribosylamine--glycine ligase